MSAREGLYAYIYLGTACPVADTDVIALLTGVELSWSQTNSPFFGMGSLHPASILRGVIGWEGRFKKAFLHTDLMGTFNSGTYTLCGSIRPRGTARPCIVGTLEFTGGSLANMEAGSEAAVMEDEGFIMHHLTFTD